MLTGLVLGVITFVGFALILNKFPRWLKKFMGKHDLFFDLLITGLSYLTLSTISSSISGAIGSAVTGICISIWLKFQHNEFAPQGEVLRQPDVRDTYPTQQ